MDKINPEEGIVTRGEIVKNINEGLTDTARTNSQELNTELKFSKKIVPVFIAKYTKIVKYVALGTTNETTVWTPKSGKKFVITDIFVSATAAGTCTLKDGTSGTTFLIASLAANGGFVSNLQTPIQSATANNNLTATASAITQYITICGYEV